MTSGKLLALAPFTAVLCPVYGEEINVSIYQIFRAQLGYKDWREEIPLRPHCVPVLIPAQHVAHAPAWLSISYFARISALNAQSRLPLARSQSGSFP